MLVSFRRTLHLEKAAKITQIVIVLMILLAAINALYAIYVYKDNPPLVLVQLIQTVSLIVQIAILFVQAVILAMQTDLYRRHEIPIIVLEHSETEYDGAEGNPVAIAIISVRNLTDNPAFYVKLQSVDAKIVGGVAVGETSNNVDCRIVEYLGPREEREMCRINDPQRFAEAVDIVKISYLDAYGDWYEVVFRVSSERGRLIFTPMPQKHAWTKA